MTTGLSTPASKSSDVFRNHGLTPSIAAEAGIYGRVFIKMHYKFARVQPGERGSCGGCMGSLFIEGY